MSLFAEIFWTTFITLGVFIVPGIIYYGWRALTN